MAPKLRRRYAWGVLSGVAAPLLIHGCESHPACVTSRDCDQGESCVYHASDGCSGTGHCYDDCGSGGDMPQSVCGCFGTVVKLGCFGGDAVAGPAVDPNDTSCMDHPCGAVGLDARCPKDTPTAYDCAVGGHPLAGAGTCIPATFSFSGSSGDTAFCCQNVTPTVR
jgi:hypothetical protein